MRIILTLLLFLMFNGKATAATESIILIGHFSNQKATEDDDPHIVSGYRVSLYQRKQTIFGSIGVATGSLEPAKGRLFDIAFNPKTKNLSFKAKYSTGWEGGKGTGPEGREARELMIFNGTLTRWGLRGTVVVRDGYELDAMGTKTREAMKRLCDDYAPRNYDEWAAYLAPAARW